MIGSQQLLGEHADVVDELVAHFASLSSDSAQAQHVVLLEAPSGYGKSRIIREFYEIIRRSGPTAYWPELLAEHETPITGNVIDPLAQRKVLGPDPSAFVWASDTLPHFGWWTFNCEQMASGSSSGLESEATDQLSAHSLALTIARNKARGRGSDVGTAFTAILDELKDFAKSELSDAAVQSLIGQVPGLDLWVKLGSRGYEAGRTALHQRRQRLATVPVGDETVEARLERARSLARLITELTAKDLPAIVVIEDAHRMGHDLRAVLDALPLGDAKHPVMVVATAWPEGADNPEYKAWVESAAVRRLLVPKLEAVELAQLIRSHYPDHITEQLALDLAKRLESPYIAKLWLTTRRVRKEVEGARDHEDLSRALLSEASLSWSILDVYMQRWRELPEDVRQALMLASSLTTEGTESAVYVPAVVDRASGAIDVSTAVGLEQSVVPFAWSRVEGGLHFIRELLMTKVAQREVAREFAESELAEFHDAVPAAAAEWLEAARSTRAVPDRAQGIAAQLVLRAQAGCSPDDVARASVVIAEMSLVSGDPESALRLLEPTKAQLALLSPALADEVLDRFVRASEFTVPAQAVIASREREARARSQAAPIGEVLRLRAQAAWSLALTADLGAGAWEPVVATYDQLLPEIASVLGELNETYIAALRDYAQVLLVGGDRVAAVREYRRLLSLMEVVCGRDSAEMLETRYEFVQLTGRDASSVEMMPIVRELVDDLLQQYGTLDHRTIKTRLALAHWRLRTPRDRKGLLREIDAIIASAVEANGAFHLDTLHAQAARSIYFSREDEIDRGIRDAESLVATAETVFGERAPEVAYFRDIARNARSKRLERLPVLAADETPGIAGVMRLPADAIAIAADLYPNLAGSVPEPSPEARRSKVLLEFWERRGNG